MMKKILLTILMLVLLCSFLSAQNFLTNKGVLTEFYGGRINIAGGINWGNQFGLRASLWTNPYFNIGLDGSISRNQQQTKTFYKIHPYIGLHARFFFTSYKLHCGVINFGKGWRIDNGSKLFDYLSITPGF